ncbi:Alpha/beta hydrolase fold-1 [Penicillium malachiteum]|uniref:Alpha/beta hydrolase fold-1 n=1 Tax=Penicillium malachiteum TaxID=1324776 RepID=UPI002547E08B|nr:Alpha/beta hydrolase fold-1 [Penicillium malachiteum]KAJ5714571.1 Alpha/beta hydrolase fold-1 [Penicillium malachiteum]
MATSKPELVIVCGAWHVPANYDKLRSHRPVPHLPTVNCSRPPTADMYTDSDLIPKIVTDLSDAGRSVAVLMHSYGGTVGTNGLADLGFETRKKQGLPGGVTRLIYLSASAHLEGESMMDIVEEFGQTNLIPLAFDFADDQTCISRHPRDLLVGPGLSDEDLESYVKLLVRWNGKGMYQTLKHCAWRKIPVTYILTTKDMTVPLDYQKRMVLTMEAEGCEIQQFTLESGHCANITHVEEVAKIVDEALA